MALRIPGPGPGPGSGAGSGQAEDGGAAADGAAGGYFERVGGSGAGGAISGVKGRIAMGIGRAKGGSQSHSHSQGPGGNGNGSGIKFVDVLSTPPLASSENENGGDTLSPLASDGIGTGTGTAGFLCLEHLAHHEYRAPTNLDALPAPATTKIAIPPPSLIPTTTTILFDSDDDCDRFANRLPAEVVKRIQVPEKEKEKGLMGALHLR